jgi:hypothetical protein
MSTHASASASWTQLPKSAWNDALPADQICAREIGADNLAVKLPEPPEKLEPSLAPKSVLVTMIVIIAAMALISIYANVQRWRRDKIESVIVTPAASPARTP